jgi:AraC-like DNA-binding protein
MLWSRVLSFSDPLACQEVIRSADVELFPTKKGSFHAEMVQIGLNGLLMHRFHISLPQIATVVVKPGRRSIGFVTEPNAPPFLHCGLTVSPGDIFVNRSDVVHQRSDTELHLGTISLPNDNLRATAEAIIGRELPETPQKAIVRPPPALTLRLLNLHKNIGQLAYDAPDILEHPEVRRALEAQLVHAMLQCLAEGAIPDSTKRGRGHDAIVAKFEAFLAENPHRLLYLTEICAGIGVAERTLRAACEEHLGMGPIRYLTLRRMHLTRRALQHADPSESTVTRIATDHGFWELGRFSVTYRALFGESPSETLRHRAEQTAIDPDYLSSLGVTERLSWLHWQRLRLPEGFGNRNDLRLTIS